MSEDRSNLDKKKQGKRPGPGPADQKQQQQQQHQQQQQQHQKKTNKDHHQVYFEPKGSEKGSNQPPLSKSNHPSANLDDPGNKGQKHDSHQSYKPKTFARSRKESRDHVIGGLRKKHPKLSKDSILEYFLTSPINNDIEDVISSTTQLFSKEKVTPVNKEDFTLDPNDGLIPKTAHVPTPSTSTAPSTTTTTATNTNANSRTNLDTTSDANKNIKPASGSNGTTEVKSPESHTTPHVTTIIITHTDNNTTNSGGSSANTSTTSKPLEMFDLSQQKLDPIQAMRAKMKKADKSKESQDAQAKPSQPQEPEKKVEAPVRVEQQEEKKPEQVKAETAPAPQNDDDDKYSDIDTKFEEKMKNNQIEDVQEDPFDDNANLQSAPRLDDDQRPEWENVDANQVVEELKREDFHSNLPQDKRTIFGNKYTEKENKSANFDPQYRTNNYGAPMKGQPGHSGVDFSKVSFDNEPNASYNDDFNVQQAEIYANGGRNSPQRSMQGAAYGQQNFSNASYNPSELQQQQQYGMAQQRGGLTHQGSYGSIGYPQNQAGYAQGQAQGQVQGQTVQRQSSSTSASTSASASASTAPNCIFKYFSPDYDKKLWSYIDLEQKVQGPYSGRTMDEWYSKGYLPPTLLVTIGVSNGFKSLKDLADVISNHYSELEGNVLKEQTQQKATPSASDYQYQQYQQQQQQQQHHQQQQMYYQQPQKQTYQPQAPVAKTVQSYQESTNYSPQLQNFLASKGKGYDANDQASYYTGQQQQQQSNANQYNQQGAGYGNYNRTAQVQEPQSQNANYYGNYNYYNQEQQQQQQKAAPSYNAAYNKVSPQTSQGSGSYYQDHNAYRTGGYNQQQQQQQQQQAYSQPQKTQQQWKGGYQGGATGYQGNNQMGSQGMGMGGQDYGNNMMYAMQQQQMAGRNINMGGNQNPGGDVSGYLKNMLGVPRSASRQGEADM